MLPLFLRVLRRFWTLEWLVLWTLCGLCIVDILFGIWFGGLFGWISVCMSSCWLPACLVVGLGADVAFWYLVLGEGTSGLVPCSMSACG